MAEHADPAGVPDTPDEWLDQFGTFTIYQALPEIIEFWGLNVQTQLELLIIGTILDMYSGLHADDLPPVYTASQNDFDKF